MKAVVLFSLFFLAFVIPSSVGADIRGGSQIQREDTNTRRLDDSGNDDDYDNGETGAFKGFFLCFSETATVEVLNRGVVPMNDLQVGDYVVTGNTKNPYQLMYAFAHRETDKSLDYYQIHTEGERHPLQISGEHLLYVANKAGAVRADSIRVGDVLHARHNTFAAVTNIERILAKGMYAPLTMDGTIVVDGIVASSYVDIHSKSHEFVEVGGVVFPFSQSDAIHLGMSPLRVAHMMGLHFELFMGQNKNGMINCIQFGFEFTRWSEQQNSLLQFAIFGLYFLMACASYMIELACSAAYGPMALLLAGLSVLAYGSVGDIRIRSVSTKKKVN